MRNYVGNILHDCCQLTSMHLFAVRIMADKCLLDYAAPWAGTHLYKGKSIWQVGLGMALKTLFYCVRPCLRPS